MADTRETIEWLKHIKEKYIHGGDDWHDHKRRQAIDHAISVLENGVTIQPLTDCKQPVGDKWVSTAERLPEMHVVRYEDCVEPTGYGECYVSEKVLAYCPIGNGIYVAECSRLDENSQLYWTEVNSDSSIHTTHWMPLPPAPKGE